MSINDKIVAENFGFNIYVNEFGMYYFYDDRPGVEQRRAFDTLQGALDFINLIRKWY